MFLGIPRCSAAGGAVYRIIINEKWVCTLLNLIVARNNLKLYGFLTKSRVFRHAFEMSQIPGIASTLVELTATPLMKIQSGNYGCKGNKLWIGYIYENY
jgi:hypothetical protein